VGLVCKRQRDAIGFQANAGDLIGVDPLGVHLQRAFDGGVYMPASGPGFEADLVHTPGALGWGLQKGLRPGRVQVTRGGF